VSERDGTAGGGWRDARPELVIAAVLVATLCATAFAFAGAAAAVLTLAGAGVIGLAALRGLVPPDDVPPDQLPEQDERGPTTFMGFWRRRMGVESATQTMTGYDYELRGTVQHLLAARLAERHGISLYDDPEAARRILAESGGDRLWYWLDPGREAVADQGKTAGIPPRTLAAILDRLERL
jgi:hypothetical protein